MLSLLFILCYHGSMEINQEIIKQLKNIGENFGVDFFVAFGSQTNGLTHKESDFDLAYLANQPLNYATEYNLNQKIQTLFPDCEIDLVDLRQATPLLQKKVLFEGNLLVELKAHSFAKFQITAGQNYFETKPLRDLAIAR